MTETSTTQSSRAAAPAKRPTFILKLRPERQVTGPVKALRFALKTLLRRYGLRCIGIREERQ